MATMGLCLASVLLLITGPLVTESLVPPRPSSCPSTSLCVQLCCPPGQIYAGYGAGSNYEKYNDEEAEYQLLEKSKCEEYSGDIKNAYKPEFDSSFKPKNVELIGKSGEQFSCPEGAHPVSADILIQPKKYTLTQSSQLNVFLDDIDFVTFNYEDFCVAFTENKENQNAGGFQYDKGPLEVTYTVCERYFEEEVGEDEVVYPVAIFISDFFVFVTLVTYLLMSECRTNMFGKITIGFLINVFFSYFFIGIHYSLDVEHNKDYYQKSSGCMMLGYFIHHTLIAVFFWMSAMSIYVTRTTLNSFIENKIKNPNRTLLVNIVYAQGSPFLITIVTLIMDTKGNPESSTLPQIGEYNCWLGHEYNPDESFASTPEFLYFYLLVIFLLLINIICFLLTGFSLFSHWWQMRGLAQGSINELFKTQLLTVTKLFFIMGIPWTFDVISAAVRHAHGESRSHSYTIRIVLDILNLLTGVLIFISLVCNKTVWARLKSSISKLQYSRTNSSETQPNSL